MVIFNSYVELPEDEWFLSGVIYCNLCVCVCLKMVYIPKMALVGGFNHLEKYESQWEG